MKIYDGHMHIGGYAEPDPVGLLERLNECGIEGGCVLSINPDNPSFTYEDRMNNLFSWVKGYEDKLFPIAWLHPHEDNVLDKVRDCVDRGVAGFKFIADNYFVGDEKPTEVFKLIEELGLPIIFHSGVLYDFSQNTDYNRPGNWECFVNYKSLKFSMGHCSHPWYDECMLLYGKFRWMMNHTRTASRGEHTIYANRPWVKEHIVEKDGKTDFVVPRLYMDTTPGAHKIYRRDLLTKICSYYPDAFQIMFGTDKHVDNYPVETVKSWLAFEKEVLDEAGASDTFRENMYCNSLMSFLGKE